MARKEEIQGMSNKFGLWSVGEAMFKLGAECADESMIGKFQDLLMEHFYEHPHESNFICTESFKNMADMMKKLKKYMEE